MQVADALHPALRDKYLSWLASEATHPDLVALLTEMRDEPWLDMVAAYLIDGQGQKSKRYRMSQLRSAHRRWRELWRAQEMPCEMADLHLPLPRRGIEIAIGLALDRAIMADPSLRTMLPIVRNLLPDQRIGSMGWRALPLSQPMMRLLLRRSGSPSEFEVPDEHQRLLTYLFANRSVRHFEVLVAAAICMLGERSLQGERNTPISIVNTIVHLNCLLRSIFSHKGLLSISEFSSKDLILYANGTFSDQARRTRVTYITSYVCCYEAQQRFKQGNPNEYKTISDLTLSPPPLNLNLESLITECLAETREKRGAYMDRVMPHYTQVLQIAAMRGLFLQYFRTAALEAFKGFGVAKTNSFSVTLPDGSAILDFRWISPRDIGFDVRGNAFAANQTYPKAMTSNDYYYLQYMGARTLSGQLLDNMPFFARIYRERYTSAQIGQDTIGQRELRNPTSTLFFPSQEFGRFVSQIAAYASNKGQPIPILLDLDALCGGVAIGILVLLISASSGMRMNEIQQIRLDDGYTLVDDTGAVNVRVRPKGRKRDRELLVTHRIDPYLIPYWRYFVLDLADARGPLKKIEIERGAVWRIPPGQYLLQWHGAPLQQGAINAMLRLVTIGTLPEGLSLTSHILRHVYARSNLALGQTLAHIQHTLGHASPLTTQIYTADTVAGSDLPLPTPLTYWEALTYDATSPT